LLKLFTVNCEFTEIDGNVLAMEPDAGGMMLAEITTPQNGAFNFQTATRSRREH
jgi:hypothetical protein